MHPVFLLMAIFLTSSSAFCAEESPPPPPPLGLPPIPWPKDNPYSKEKAELGRLLYFDKRLSSDQTISCASCHKISCGYSDCNPVALGIGNAKGTRNSPTLINSAYQPIFFWDGRASSLEEQSKAPLANPKEMTTFVDPHEAHQESIHHIQKTPGYKPLFMKAFGNDKMTLEQISQAIATFERTILSGNSPYDRYIAGNTSAMTEEQILGWKIFKNSGCTSCHKGFNFTDYRFVNIGVGMDVPNPDLGRYAITHQDKDWGAFKTPTLRDIAKTAPYMHDGSLKTLEEVIDYYDRGGNKNKNLDPLMEPLNLSPEEKQALVSFLKALNGENEPIQEPTEFPK